MLTRRQREVLDFVEHYLKEKGYSPSLEEIARALGLRSLATVHRHVTNLCAKGYLKRDRNRGRSLEVRHGAGGTIAAVPVPLVGRIAAGVPIEAVEMVDTLWIPEEMLGASETFALVVKGDSMVGEHICDGDFVIVERRYEAANGETVVALIRSTEATLKKFYLEGEQVRLQPANPELEPLLVPASEVTIQGVVVGLIRRYR